MKLTGQTEKSASLDHFLAQGGGGVAAAAARGLNEHAGETRRQSVVRIGNVTGVPRGRIAGEISVRNAAPGPVMEARVVASGKAIGIHEYGKPRWVADLSPRQVAPGTFRGARSSMPGAEATGWNRRKMFKGAFMAKGKVFWRDRATGRLRLVWGPVIRNELVDESKSNIKGAREFMRLDLTNRVLRYIAMTFGG